MTERDDNDGERELAQLRASYARIPRAEPGDAADAAIRHAARRHDAQRRLRRWSGAAAVAACAGLAVVLVPTLLIETPAPPDRDVLAVVVLQSEPPQPGRVAPEERAGMELRVSPAPMAAPSATVDEDERALFAGDDAPTSSTSAIPDPGNPSPAAKPVYGDEPAPAPVTGARTDAASAEAIAREAAALRTELENADARAWRERLLALRAAGREALALMLLEDFRRRFQRPDSFTLDDLAAEDAAQNLPE